MSATVIVLRPAVASHLFMHRSILVRICSIGLLVNLTGCDQLPQQNRYEITKDQSGRTLRIDKRTGDVSIIDGDRIVPVVDGKTALDQTALENSSLAAAKIFPPIRVRHMLLEAELRTSWQDGKIYYSVDVRPRTDEDTTSKGKELAARLAEKEAGLVKFRATIAAHNFSLLIEDVPFELLQDRLKFIGVTNDQGSVVAYNAKGSVPMGKDTYKRIDSWNMSWAKRS